MDVIKILDANHARRKWAEEAEAMDKAATLEAMERARAARKARRKREALVQAHWASGVGVGIMAVLAGVCVSKAYVLLAVSCAFGASAFLIAAAIVEDLLDGR